MDHPVFLSYHHYLEDARIVERYRAGELPAHESAEFEAHFVDCQECRDRLTLDQIFHRSSGNHDAESGKPGRPVGEPDPGAFRNAPPVDDDPNPTGASAASAGQPHHGAGPGAVFTFLSRLSAPLQVTVFVLGLALVAGAGAFLVVSHYGSVQASNEARIVLQTNRTGTHAIPYSAEWLDFQIDQPADAGIFQVSFVQVSGSAMLRLPDQLGPFSTLRVPASMLPSGEYWMHVERKNSDGTTAGKTTYTFGLQRED